MPAEAPVRRLLVVLGDQLDADAALLADADPAHDAVWLCEAASEATRVWSHKARIALFLAAMRHFAERLRVRGWRVIHRALDAHDHPDLASALAVDLAALAPDEVAMTEAGEHDLQVALTDAATRAGYTLRVAPDDHFLCTRDAFAQWLDGRRQPRMEHFYRWMRRDTGLLMDGDQPAGGRWNFDAENRASFGREGPGRLPAPASFAPDTTAKAVLTAPRAS